MSGPFPSVPIYFVTNAGTAAAALNILNVIGSGGTVVTGSGNTITIGVTGSGMTWSRITASQTLAVNNGYFCVSPGGALSLALPATSNIGDEIEIALKGATSFTVTQGAGQSIEIGNQITTVGVGGSLTSTQQGDVLRMVCMNTNLIWQIMSSIGNLTVV
jgi:hypothetical protein